MEENEKKYPVSKHIFMFPFIIKNPDRYKKEFSKDKKWTPYNFSIKDELDYNEYNYFYPFVQKLLFPDTDASNSILSKYHWKFQKGKFLISILEKKKDEESGQQVEIEKDFILDFSTKGIELIILEDFSIGILIFYLDNHLEKSFDNVLKINDYARRIYPQFLPLIDGKFGGSQRAFLPVKISINLDEKNITTEDFSSYNDLTGFRGIKYASYIAFFLNGIEYNHVLDDRMFVLSYLKNNEEGEKILYSYPGYAKSLSEKNNKINTKAIDNWYKYCFVDGNSLTCQSDIMKQELLTKCTYDRWNKWGILWGITRYSLVALFTESVPTFLLDHVSLQYKDLSLMWLINRAVLLKFAAESSDLAKLIKTDNGNRNQRKYVKKITELRKNYITFVNDVWFTEVTPQEQGIEMYQMGMKQMELEKQKNDLRKDIEELFDYVEAENEKSETRSMNRLYYLGALFLPATLMAGLLGMNISYFLNPAISNNKALFLLLIPTIFLMSLTTLLILKKSKLWKFFITLLIILIILMIFAPRYDSIKFIINAVFNFLNV